MALFIAQKSSPTFCFSRFFSRRFLVLASSNWMWSRTRMSADFPPEVRKNMLTKQHNGKQLIKVLIPVVSYNPLVPVTYCAWTIGCLWSLIRMVPLVHQWLTCAPHASFFTHSSHTIRFLPCSWEERFRIVKVDGFCLFQRICSQKKTIICVTEEGIFKSLLRKKIIVFLI